MLGPPGAGFAAGGGKVMDFLDDQAASPLVNGPACRWPE